MSDKLAEFLLRTGGKSDFQSSAETYRPQLGDTVTLGAIRSALAKGNLSLVLGAGISWDSGLPMWEELVSKIMTQLLPGGARLSERLSKSHLSAGGRIRLIEEVGGLRGAFKLALRDQLYVGHSCLADNLRAVARFILGTGSQEAVSRIVTYNFDDLLERALKAEIERSSLPYKVHSIYSRETCRSGWSKEDICVYHPHGFIPLDGTLDHVVTTDIVLSEREFHHHYLNPSHWANIAQSGIYFSHTCLFIGLSFVDPNLRRILDSTKCHHGGHHYAIKCISDAADEADRNLDCYIFERDTASLGVHTLWINRHEEILDIVRALRS